MAKLHYDPVTDWRLCDRVTPAALRDELRACGCRFEMDSENETMLTACAPPPHRAELWLPNGDTLPGWRDAKVASLSFVRHIRSTHWGYEVTQWGVLRRLLWRSHDWRGLAWLAWHWAITRVTRTNFLGLAKWSTK